MTSRIAIALVVLSWISQARAEHVHGAMAEEARGHGDGASQDDSPRSRVSIGLAMFAASYSAYLYEGDYHGATVRAGWDRGWLGFGAELSAYRLSRNGQDLDGLGDVQLHAHATVFERGAVAAGAMMMASLPTGDSDGGLGMGHAMVMPELWAMVRRGRWDVSASTGYSRMLGGALAHAMHGGGMWPLVDPMTAEELTGRGAVMFELGRVIDGALAVGARAQGAVPLDAGDARLAAGGRARWTHGRVTASIEVLRGWIGDPFGTRGSVEAAMAFE